MLSSRANDNPPMCCNLQASCESTHMVDSSKGNELDAAPDLDVEELDYVDDS